MVIPQGTNNSRSVMLQTDGELNTDLCAIINGADLTVGALQNGMAATTQSAGDNTTKIATDAFVQTAIGGAGAVLWSALGNAAADLTLANAGFKTTFNQTSAVAWLWANTTAATSTVAFYSDGSSLSAWTNSGVTVDAGVGNPSPSFSIASTKYAYINAGVANGTTVQFDFYGTSLSTQVFSLDFGQNSSGNGPRFRLDCRGSFNSGFSISAAGSFPNDGGPSTGTKIIATPSLSTWHRLAIVIAANGLSASWYLDGALQGNGALAGGILGGYLCLYSAGGAGIWIDNIAVYSASVPANSPSLVLGGTYWNAAGNASASETWTIQNQPESSVASPALLAITHSGTTDAAFVQVPNLNAVGAVALTSGAVSWGATFNTPDTGISRVSAGHLGLGNGTAGDYSAAVQCASIVGPITANGTDWAWYLAATGVRINSTLPLAWSSGVATSTLDTGISRLGAASLAIGNGTASDTTGNLSFNKVIKYAGVATVSAGVPSELATVDLTAQSAAITATTLYAVPAAGAGMYRITWVAKITTEDARLPLWEELTGSKYHLLRLRIQ